jgi:hypothetical protein
MPAVGVGPEGQPNHLGIIAVKLQTVAKYSEQVIHAAFEIKYNPFPIF